nr:MAG TPA: hypothetical protein [Caudoviricetes sp.]
MITSHHSNEIWTRGRANTASFLFNYSRLEIRTWVTGNHAILVCEKIPGLEILKIF